jgi:RimK family alpha-L-glutamate ligase
LKIGIFGPENGEWHVERLLKELKSRGVDSYVFPITRVQSMIGMKPSLSVRGYTLDDYDAVIVRRVPGGSSEQVFYRMDSLHRLEDKGVKVFNPSRGIERAVDKFYTSAILEDSGIRTPRTVVTESFGEAMKWFRRLGEDVVVKPLFGSLGMGIVRVSSEDIAYRVFRALESTRSVYYIQEYIEHGGVDLRIFVIGEEAVSGMRRVADSWKTNISIGGKAHPYEPESEHVELSIRASKALGLEYTGVDVLESGEGTPYVIELNSTPGWRGIQSVTKLDITKAIIDHVVSKV